MHYKTITLELLQDQFPTLHRRLRNQRKLLETLDQYARMLRDSHLAWRDQLARTRPDSHPGQITSEALELAIEDLMDALSSAMPPVDDPAEPLSLDAAMTDLRRRTPPA